MNKSIFKYTDWLPSEPWYNKLLPQIIIACLIAMICLLGLFYFAGLELESILKNSECIK